MKINIINVVDVVYNNMQIRNKFRICILLVFEDKMSYNECAVFFIASSKSYATQKYWTT